MATTRTKAKTKTKAPAKSKARAKTKTRAKATAKAKSKAKTKTGVKAKAKARAKVTAKAKPKAKAKAKTKSSSAPKTTPTGASVTAFLKQLGDDQQRADCRRLMKMMRAATGKPAKMWGPSIVGFGQYHYKYHSGREGDWMLVGFSPRSGKISVYVMPGFAEFGPQMAKLGKHKTGKSCLYIKKLADVDEQVLDEIVRKSVVWMRQKYG